MFSAHYVEIFLCKLEGCLFKLYTHVARWILQIEPKINMYQMTLRINKNITVVAILHIEKVCENRVAS